MICKNKVFCCNSQNKNSRSGLPPGIFGFGFGLFLLCYHVVCRVESANVGRVIAFVVNLEGFALVVA
jgi:hypothetical protein